MRRLLTGVIQLFVYLVDVLIEPRMTRWFLDYPRHPTPKNGEKPSEDTDEKAEG